MVLAISIVKVSAQSAFLPVGDRFLDSWVPTNGQVTASLRFVANSNLTRYISPASTAYFESYAVCKAYALAKVNKLSTLAKARLKSESVSDIKYSVRIVLGGVAYDFSSALETVANLQPKDFVVRIPAFESVTISNVNSLVLVRNGVEQELSTNGTAIIGGSNLIVSGPAKYVLVANGQTNTYTQGGDLFTPAYLSITNPSLVTVRMTPGASTVVELSSNLVTWRAVRYYDWTAKVSVDSLDLSDPGLWNPYWWENVGWVWHTNLVWVSDPEGSLDGSPDGTPGHWEDNGWPEEIYRPPPKVNIGFIRARSTCGDDDLSYCWW
jgi:hypothetical protein